MPARSFLKKILTSVFVLLILTVIFMSGMNEARAYVQKKPKMDPGQDTTFVLRMVAADSIVVTPGDVPASVERSRRTLSHANPLHRLIERTGLATSVSGQTADLQRDLPSMIRFYMPQGIPLVTKYTSNNALTTTIPDNAVTLELREPSARYPNPDAPVILQTDYRLRRNVAVTPFKQSAGLTTGEAHSLKGGLSLERSGPPGMLEDLIPELGAYSTTYAFFGAGQAKYNNLQSEVVAHYSYSENEFGDLLGVDWLEEIDENHYLFANFQYNLQNNIILHAGMGYQQGDADKYVEEYETQYNEDHKVRLTTYTAAAEWNDLILRAAYHEMSRSYPEAEDGFRMKRLEALLGYQLELHHSARVNLESGYDFRDEEPSFSAQLQWQPVRRLYLSLDAARVYDPVGSEALNSTIREIQRSPYPWETTYARIGTNLLWQEMNFNASLIYKEVRLGWYDNPATVRGWVPRVGIKGRFPGRHYIGWQLEGTARSLDLEQEGEQTRSMPGAARFQGHAALEVSIHNMHYVLKTDIFFDREQLVRSEITADLGAQYFITIGAAYSIDPVEIGIRVDNTLGFFGFGNRMIAWYSENDGGMNYADAPPLPSLSVLVDF